MPDPVCVPLSPLDLFPPRLYIKFAIYLSLTSQDDATQACACLRGAFVETVRQLPFLSGKVFARQKTSLGVRPGQLEIRYYSEEADQDLSHLTRFQDLSTSLNFANLRSNGFPDSTIDSSVILPAPLMPNISQGADVWTAQVTLINGGVIVAAGLHHSTLDGTGMIAVMKRYADNCRKLQGKSTLQLPMPVDSRLSDRNSLEAVWREEGCLTRESVGYHVDELYAVLGLEPPQPTRIEADGKSAWLPSKEGAAPALVPGLLHLVRLALGIWLAFVAMMRRCKQQVSEKLLVFRFAAGLLSASIVPSLAMQTGIFYLPAKSLARLKQDAATEAVDGMQGTLTANDALMALLWGAIMRARFPADTGDLRTTSARLDCTLDARDKMSSSLSPDYLGNVVLMSPTILPLAKVASPATSTGELASFIRKDLDGVTAQKVQAAFSIAAGLDNYANLKFGFMDPSMPSTMITSMLMAPFAEYDFGPAFGNSGRPESLRTIMADFNKVTRMCFVLPRKRHGGIEIVITLQKAEMSRLLADKRFARYVSFLCH